MKIRIHKNGFETQVIEDVKMVVVYDEHDNPMYISNQVDENNCVHEKAGGKGFEDLLKSFGLRLHVPYKTVSM